LRSTWHTQGLLRTLCAMYLFEPLPLARHTPETSPVSGMALELKARIFRHQIDPDFSKIRQWKAMDLPSQNFGRPVVTVCLWGDVTREPPILAVPRAAGLWNCMGAAATSEPACTDHAPILTSKTRLCARSAILRMRDKQQCTETLPSLQIMITHCSAYGGACTVSHVPITIMRQKIVEGTI